MAEPAFDISALRPWIEAQFSRSPGPGGQNVNKVSTRVTLLFDFEACPALSGSQRAQVREQFRTRLSRDGRLRIVRHRERTQARNREAAEMHLAVLLTQAVAQDKARKPTKPTRGSKHRRLADKRHRSQLKKQRHSVADE